MWRVSVVLLTGLVGILLKEPLLNYLFLGFLLLYLGHHLIVLIRLRHRLLAGEEVQPPFPGGLWRDVFVQVQRLQRRKQRKGKFSRFREVASTLQDAVVIIGEQGEIQWCNPAAEPMLGLLWPKAMRQPLVQLVCHPVLEEYFTNDDYSTPIVINSPADTTRILSLSIDRFGKAQHRLLVARDITQIYHLNQAQQDFIANVSHELRTPLTVIMGFLESLQYSEVNQDRWARSMELMESQARRMQEIIEELLTLSRLQMTDQPSTVKPVPVPRLLDSITQEARALSGDSAHALTLEVNPDLWLKGNSNELRSAFSNLIFNAIKHTPPRGEIHIRWDTDEHGVFLAVTDTGEGIAARHIPRLTERFYRVDPARSRKSGGTGLGLAIVKHVLDRHGGELQINSKVGQGSTFICCFPSQRVVSHKAESIASEKKSLPIDSAPTQPS